MACLGSAAKTKPSLHQRSVRLRMWSSFWSSDPTPINWSRVSHLFLSIAPVLATSSRGPAIKNVITTYRTRNRTGLIVKAASRHGANKKTATDEPLPQLVSPWRCSRTSSVQRLAQLSNVWCAEFCGHVVWEFYEGVPLLLSVELRSANFKHYKSGVSEKYSCLSPHRPRNSCATHLARIWELSSDPLFAMTHLVRMTRHTPSSQHQTEEQYRRLPSCPQNPSLPSWLDGPELDQTPRIAQPDPEHHISADARTSRWSSSASLLCCCGLLREDPGVATHSTWAPWWSHRWSRQQLCHLSPKHVICHEIHSSSHSHRQETSLSHDRPPDTARLTSQSSWSMTRSRVEWSAWNHFRHSDASCSCWKNCSLRHSSLDQVHRLQAQTVLTRLEVRGQSWMTQLRLEEPKALTLTGNLTPLHCCQLDLPQIQLSSMPALWARRPPEWRHEAGPVPLPFSCALPRRGFDIPQRVLARAHRWPAPCNPDTFSGLGHDLGWVEEHQPDVSPNVVQRDWPPLEFTLSTWTRLASSPHRRSRKGLLVTEPPTCHRGWLSWLSEPSEICRRNLPQRSERIWGRNQVTLPQHTLGLNLFTLSNAGSLSHTRSPNPASGVSNLRESSEWSLHRVSPGPTHLDGEVVTSTKRVC